MAKRKPDVNEFKEEETFEQAIEKDGEVVIVKDPSHLKPMEERTGPPPRPKAVDPKHLKPME